jgi:glycosyltransferase involved in cell wall biosynthesis
MAARHALEQVSFAGHIANPSRIWGKNHALLLPSRHEGLPLVIVEAMRHARTVITTAVADNARFITDGVNGFISPAAAPQPLADTLQRAWDARHRWREMGLLARESILKQLPHDPVAEFARRLLA